MKILLVDDSRTIRNIQKNVLAEIGYTEVVEAGDGMEALSRIAAEKPDLMLVDWNMPNMDGITLVRKIRESDKTTPIIMCTTKGEETDKIWGMRQGALAYLVKPVDHQDLLARIRAMG